MSKQRVLSSRKVTSSSMDLEAFLNEAPLKYNSELQNEEKQEILSQCYNSLWDAKADWMIEYFSKEIEIDNNTQKEHDHQSKHVHQEGQERGKQCGHVFKKGEIIYRCRNCGLDDTCVLCSTCFQSTNHDGHDIRITISPGSGGCCDCGDPEAWKIPLQCNIHSSDPAKENFKKPIASVPPQLLQSVRDTISTVLDYILDTFAASPENVSTVTGTRELKSDCVASHKALGLPGITDNQTYVCILWNDEKHSFDDVITVIEQAFEVSEAEAKLAAERVDKHGRCIIERSTSLKHLTRGARKISQVGLGVSISSLEKTIREDIAGLLLQWLNELVRGNPAFFDSVKDGNCIIQDIMYEVLLEDWTLGPKLARLSIRQRKNKSNTNKEEEVINISEDEMEQVERSDQTDAQNTISLLTESELDSESEDDTMDNIQALLYQVGTEESDASPSEEDDMWDIGNTFRPPNTTQERSTFSANFDGLLRRISRTDRSSEISKKRKISSSPLNRKDIYDAGDLDWKLDYWLDRTEEIEMIENSKLNKTEAQFAAPFEQSRSINDASLTKELKRKLRLDYLLRYEFRLWKTARENINDLYIATFISNPNYRIELGKRFARNYPDIMQAYIFKDREVDYSIAKLSVQLLTAPTVAISLVKDYRMFSMILTIMTNYFLKHEVSMSLPSYYDNLQVESSSKAASSPQSYNVLFQHLRYIMDIKPMRLEFVKTPLHLYQFVNFLSHFQAMDALKRKANIHVEYESDSYSNVFEINRHLSKLCRLFAGSFDIPESEMSTIEVAHHLSRTICCVLRAIGSWDPRILTVEGVKESNRLVKGIPLQYVRNIPSVSGGVFQIVDYDVAKLPVSFHHPLHWLLSKLLENTRLLEDHVLQQVGWTLGLDQMIQSALGTLDTPGIDQFLKVLDYPIRTLTLLAQISCNVWIRNGQNVTHQMHKYRDTKWRPNTLDNDIYLLQTGFTICNHNQILLTLISRFNLLDWFCGHPIERHNVYDKAQVLSMVEELLNLLIIIATEHGKLSGASDKQTVRQFIIQFLAIHDLTYSELLKVIPGHLNDGSFETYLNELAIFKPPTGLEDRGLYELKSEYMNEVNPYFWYYTRNERDEAQDALRKHHNRSHPNQPIGESDEFLYLPSVMDLSHLGPFKGITSFLHSHIFCQIILYSLENYRSFKDQMNDTILDLALHLTILAVMDSERIESERLKKEILTPSDWVPVPTFIDNAISNKLPIERSTETATTECVNLLTIIFSYLNDSQRLAHTHKRMSFILDKIQAGAPQDVKQHIDEWKQSHQLSKNAMSGSKDSSEMSDFERKKAAAKARQAAIMSQMANAQLQFMEQHSDMYEDEEIEDEEEEEEEEKEKENNAMDTSGSIDDSDSLQVIRMCHFPTENCIVCQEQLNESELFGMLAFVQNSNIQRTAALDDKDVWSDILRASESTDPWIDRSQDRQSFNGFPTEAHKRGMKISSCNHMMHADCFSRYQNTLEAQTYVDNRRSNTETSLNGRFLCPLCKAIGNMLIPVIWKSKKESYPGVLVYRSSFSELRDHALSLRTELNLKIEEIHDPEFHGMHFVNQDSNIFLNNVDGLKTLYNQLNLMIFKTQNQTSGSLTIDSDDLELNNCLRSLYKVYAFAISNLEIAQRGNDADATKRTRDLTVEYTGTLMDDIPTTTQTFLKILGLTNDFLPKLMASTWDVDEMMTKECLALNGLKKMFPDDFSIFNKVRPLLLEDPFEIMVLLGFSTCEYPQLEVHHTLRAMYIAEITRIVIGLYQSVANLEDALLSVKDILNGLNASQNDPTKARTAEYFVRYVLRLLNVENDMIAFFLNVIHPGALFSIIRTFVLPFIRKSLVFMVVYHGLVLQTPEAESHGQMSEYEYLLHVLGLPSLEDVFEFQTTENNLISSWCQHFIAFSTTSSSVIAASSSNQVVTTTTLRPIKLLLPVQHKLVTLPYRLDTLFSESLKRKCFKCNTVPEYSAICLICGQFVCARRFCCTENNRGECNTHMKSCGGDIGMYLIIKDCFILLLHQDGGGTVMGAPYLDSHGEPDLFLKRGTPQYLNLKRYEQLQQMWVNQTVATYIRRCMDSVSTTAAWEFF